jgi:hypothetical protein
MAAILREGQKRKWCEPTAELKRSGQIQCHGNFRRTWRSLLT